MTEEYRRGFKDGYAQCAADSGLEPTREQLVNENRALREANRELFEALERAKAVICELRRGKT